MSTAWRVRARLGHRAERTIAMMTAEQYRDSLRDGRRVFCQGTEIDDVTTHPLTRLAVDWVAGG